MQNTAFEYNTIKTMNNKLYFLYENLIRISGIATSRRYSLHTHPKSREKRAWFYNDQFQNRAASTNMNLAKRLNVGANFWRTRKFQTELKANY